VGGSSRVREGCCQRKQGGRKGEEKKNHEQKNAAVPGEGGPRKEGGGKTWQRWKVPPKSQFPPGKEMGGEKKGEVANWQFPVVRPHDKEKKKKKIEKKKKGGGGANSARRQAVAIPYPLVDGGEKGSRKGFLENAVPLWPVVARPSPLPKLHGKAQEKNESTPFPPLFLSLDSKKGGGSYRKGGGVADVPSPLFIESKHGPRKEIGLGVESFLFFFSFEK